MFPQLPRDSARRMMLLMGLGLWLAPFANAQERGMVPTASSSALDGPTTYVLAVGVADFKHLAPDFDLRYAEADASAFTEGLASALGESLPRDHVTVLVGDDATFERVSGALRETLAAADEDDTVILFFSTHGVLVGDEGYLLTWDTTPNERLPYTSLPTKDVVSAVNRSRAAHVLLFTDACHAGITGAGTKGASVPSFDPSKIQVDHRSFFNQASSTIMQPSLENPEYCGGHGAYTCALLRAMQGEVDHDGDGAVSLRELQIYVPPIVDSLTKGKQSPETKGRYDSQHVFVRVLPKPSDQKVAEEDGFSFADVAPEEIGVMDTHEDESATTPHEGPIAGHPVGEAYDDEAGTALIPVVESDDALGGGESSAAEIVVSDGGSVASEESMQRSVVPVVIEEDLLIPRIELQQNPYNEGEDDETIFVTYSELLLGPPETEETQSLGGPAFDGGQLSLANAVPQVDDRVLPSNLSATRQTDSFKSRQISSTLALFVTPLAAGATYYHLVLNERNEPITWASATALVALTEYTAIRSFQTCRLIVDEWSRSRNEHLRLRCQIGVTNVTVASASFFLAYIAGLPPILDELWGFNLSNKYSDYAFYAGIGAASAAGTSILLSTGQHLNNARLIPGVSTPGTSYMPPDPAQPMWAQAGWSPMGLTVVGTF
jgi:uncharacterized caspase-like protein